MAREDRGVGKSYAPVFYAVGREKIREYASPSARPTRCTTTSTRPATPATPTSSAPPMFAVVYARPAMAPAIFDPEVGIDFARMVHGGQEFRWGPPVVAGDEITTEVEVKDVGERGGMAFYVFESAPPTRRRDGLHRHLDQHRPGGLTGRPGARSSPSSRSRRTAT